MTERELRMMNELLEENDLVSATDCTGAAPRALDDAAAHTIEALTDMRCSPSFTAEDPAHSPLLGGNAGLSGTHNRRSTTPSRRSASGPAPSRRD